MQKQERVQPDNREKQGRCALGAVPTCSVCWVAEQPQQGCQSHYMFEHVDTILYLCFDVSCVL